MTPKTNRKLTLGFAALLCGLLVPSAIGASGELQTFQLKLHQGHNTLTPVDPVNKPGLFNMFDVGEVTLLGRYVNTGLVQMVPIPDPPGFAILFGAGTLTAANGDSIGWEFQPNPEHPDRIFMLPGTGTGRFLGATGYIDSFAVSTTPNPDGTVTGIHWAEGELTVPKKTEPASGKLQTVTRPWEMQAYSEMVVSLPDMSFLSSTAWIDASHCGKSMAYAGKPDAPDRGHIIAANGDVIYFDMPSQLQGIITGGTGRFAGASGEFNVEEPTPIGMKPGPEPGTAIICFVWTATGTITY